MDRRGRGMKTLVSLLTLTAAATFLDRAAGLG